MADNIAVTPGSGVTVAGDDISGVLHQRVKIEHGADGSATDVSTASPLPTRNVGITIAQAPTVTAGAYSAKDVVGGLLTFANAVRAAGGHGIINTLVFTDLGVTGNVLQLWLYDTLPATIADNAAFDVPDAELPTVVGIIDIAAADYHVATDNQAVCLKNVGLQYTCVTTSLYGYLMCTGTPTYASTTDITIQLGIQYLD